MKIGEIDHENVNYAPFKNISLHCAVTVFLWQYQLWSFKGGIQNWEGLWLKINSSQMKLPHFDNWSNGKLSKIEHYFRK